MSPNKYTESNAKLPLSCLVSRPGPDGFACSGILLPGPERWVLTHGSLLGCWLKRYPSVRRFVAELDELTLWPEEINGDTRLEVIWHKNEERVFAKVALAWRCPLLSRATRSLLVECVFEDAAAPTATSPATEASLRPVASIFVLLCDATYNNSYNLLDEGRMALGRLLYSTSNASSGDPIRCISTPFGAQAFLMAVSEGVVSRLAGPKGVLMLTDASAAPGCEGAPIFSAKTGDLIAMVTFPLTWWRGEWLGFTLAATLRPILENILGDASAISSASALKHNQENVTPSNSLANILSNSVALVRRGEIWGSGVLISETILLTCSHIFTKAPAGAHCRVEIGGCEFHANVIFRTADFRPYDVAILKLKTSSKPKHIKLNPLKFAEEGTKTGDSVWAAGYPTFRAQFDNDLVVTKGVVSRVTRPAHALATTCCIQSGQSGGPLLRPEDFAILGMVVSNAKVSDTGAVHPRINLAVPATVLRVPIDQYLLTQDARCLSVLEQTDPKVESLWAYREPSACKL